MAAIFDNNDNKMLTASTLGISSDESVLVAGWHKYDSTYAKSSVAVLSQIADGTSGGSPSMRYSHDASSKGATFVNEAYRTQTADTFADDTWFLWGMKYGPWDNASRVCEFWLNANHSQTNVTLNNAGVTIDNIHIGRWGNGASAGAHGRIAHVAVWANKSEAQTDTVMSEFLTTTPDAISIAPTYYWPLLNSVTATTGGIDLTNAGAVTFDADMPTLGGGGPGGAEFFSPIMFRRPWQGWRERLSGLWWPQPAGVVV